MGEQGFNYKGRRYTFAVMAGLSHEYALDRLAARRKLAPQFLWAIKKTRDGTYGLGRAPRK